MGLLDRFRSNGKGNWVATKGSDQGSDDGNFDDFRYWKPNDQLEREIAKAAKQTGLKDLPIVTAVRVEDPPGIEYVFSVTYEAMSHVNSEAVDLLEGIATQLSDCMQILRQDPASLTPNTQRSVARYVSVLRQYRSLRVRLDQLDNAVRIRLNRIMRHGNGLIDKYELIVSKHHSYPDPLHRRWTPSRITVLPEFLEYGQSEVRDQLCSFESELKTSQVHERLVQLVGDLDFSDPATDPYRSASQADKSSNPNNPQ